MENRKKNPQPSYRPESAPDRREQIVRDLGAYLTPEDIESALEVLRHRLKRKNVRTAKYVLELVFGKPHAVNSRSRAALRAKLSRNLFGR